MVANAITGAYRDRQHAVLFVLGLSLVVAGVALAGTVRGIDIVFRLAGYGLLAYAPAAYLRDRILG
ncbi:MAG: hypothetical protein V5A23_09650 [Halobacteriales archaeon]